MAYLARSDGPVNSPKKMNPCMKTIIRWKTISVIILRGAKNPKTITRSNDISTLNGLSFVLLAAYVRLKRHPATNEKSQKVKSPKVYFATFRLYLGISIFLYIYIYRGIF